MQQVVHLHTVAKKNVYTKLVRRHDDDVKNDEKLILEPLQLLPTLLQA